MEKRRRRKERQVYGCVFSLTGGRHTLMGRVCVGGCLCVKCVASVALALRAPRVRPSVCLSADAGTTARAGEKTEEVNKTFLRRRKGGDSGSQWLVSG